MPIYEFRCATCGGRPTTAYRKIDERHDGPLCACGEAMQLQISAPYVAPDYAGYTSPIDGRWIEGRKAHAEDLKRNGCRLYDPSEKDAIVKRREADDKALDDAVGETVDRTIASWDSRKREKLAAEMEGGMDVEVVRTAA